MATVYLADDLKHEDSFLFYVMPYVKGESTVSARLPCGVPWVGQSGLAA